ncbi:MAG: M43 family zinc metalloprotease [Saprospiraceae bacterium]
MCCLISSSLNQITALNSDFNSTNPDISIYTTISNVCPQLYPITSLSQGMNVEFYIANSNHPPSSGLNEGDYAITVGQEEFPSAGTEWGGYFNIFVDDDWGTSSALGESSAIQGLTGSGSGVVIHPSVFGGPGASCTSGTSFNTDPSLNLGRTLTHEAGHYFGLYHIFNGCNDGDDINDTPDQCLDHNGSSPTFNFSTCQPNVSSGCSNTNCFYMNFMDYTNDNTMVMFSADQANLIRTWILLSYWKSGTNDYPIICSTYSAPALTSTNVNLACPATTFDLTTLNVNAAIPCNSIIRWENAYGTIITAPIIESGIYFASYYNTISNCYGPSQQVSILFNCCEQPDININTNTVYNTPRYVGGNIIVNAGKTLDIHSTNVLFRQGKGIIVKNGGRLILKGSTLNACNQSLSWAGIKIESGGFFNTDETFLKNVANGVDAYSNSTLQIYKLNIDGKGNTSGIGLKLDGNVNTDFIYNMDIKDFNTGIQTNSSAKVHEFNHGSINNTSYGIYSINSPIIVNDYNINFTKDAITLIASAGSSIFDCNIIYQEQGIAITISPTTTVENCSISNNNWWSGIENLNERPAIGMVLSDGCTIKNNFTIASASNAVSAWGSNGAMIENNNISTNFSLNGQLTGGPINLQFGNGHTITQNHISADQSEFGINSTWAGNTTIMNNTVYNSGFQKNFRTAAIKATGNLNEVIDQNIVTGDRRTGVLVQNTTGNQYFCNEINSVYDEANDILYNSEQQTIKANTFDGSGFDLKIKSEIGNQATYNSNNIPIENWGNVFLGGNAEADPQVFTFSQFPYNTGYGTSLNHRPSNPNPTSGWFVPNNVTAYQDCDGLVIGDNFIFGNDPNKICAYWNYLKSIQNTKPELFFVKLVHLLKYSKTKAGFTLPNCIKFDPVFQTLCGITKIVDVSVALAKVSESNLNDGNVKALQAQYQNETSDAGKAAIKEQMSIEINSIKPLLDIERNADSLRLDSLKNELNTINCTSVIVNKWKEILKIYINFIKQGKVANSDKAALEAYATDCSDLNGEAIHLARAMANTYNRIYYDVYDGCLESAEPRVTLKLKDVDVSVAPNPANGIVNMTFSSEFTGSIDVFNSSGQKVHAKFIDKINLATIDLSNEVGGLYFLKTTSSSGDTKEFKVILIK